MPCWTVQQSTVELKNPNLELLKAALTEMGYHVSDYAGHIYADRFTDRTSVVYQNGNLKVTASKAATDLTALSNELKRAYSVETVKFTAKQFGWQLKESGPLKFQAQRRGL